MTVWVREEDEKAPENRQRLVFVFMLSLGLLCKCSSDIFCPPDYVLLNW